VGVGVALRNSALDIMVPKVTPIHTRISAAIPAALTFKPEPPSGLAGGYTGADGGGLGEGKTSERSSDKATASPQ
jgi:hypothetical protein